MYLPLFFVSVLLSVYTYKLTTVPIHRSHFQSTGADQAAMLELELSKLGFSCWLDNRAVDLTKAGMRNGIESAGCFLLFLSAGCLGRAFVQYELRCALEMERQIVLVHESDPRHAPFNFSTDRQLAPEALRHVLDDVESLVSGGNFYSLL